MPHVYIDAELILEECEDKELIAELASRGYQCVRTMKIDGECFDDFPTRDEIIEALNKFHFSPSDISPIKELVWKGIGRIM